MPDKLVVIGGSAGSLEVITQILPSLLPSDSAAIILVVHRKTIPGTSFPKLLSRNSNWKVTEVEEKYHLQPGIVYTIPSDFHLLIEEDKTFSLDYSEKINFCRPSIDVTMESAAEIFKMNTMGVLLSGANNDGVNGMERILKFGGKIIIQDPSSASLDIMPKQAMEKLKLTKAYDTASIITAINGFIASHR